LIELKERRKGGRAPRFGTEEMVNHRGEIRKGGKRIPFIVAPRADAGRHRSDRWQPLVKPERPYRFFRPPHLLVEPKILIKFNRESLSVEPTRPR
jgi:hypothetical protein